MINIVELDGAEEAEIPNLQKLLIVMIDRIRIVCLSVFHYAHVLSGFFYDKALMILQALRDIFLGHFFSWDASVFDKYHLRRIAILFIHNPTPLPVR